MRITMGLYGLRERRCRSRHHQRQSRRGSRARRASVDLPQRRRRRPTPRPATSCRCAAPRGRPLGHALFSDRSRDHAPDARRTATQPRRRRARRARGSTPAIAFRESLGIDATAYRLVHGEADLLPSLIVDRYGDYLVVQALSQGMDRLLPRDHRGARSSCCSRAGILARNDPRVRLLEGLEQRSRSCTARCPDRIEVREGRGRVRRRSLARPEDRAVPRSAREPRGRGCATRAAGCSTVQLQRRLRAGAGAAVRRGARGRHLRGRRRADPRERRRATASRTSRRAR